MKTKLTEIMKEVVPSQKLKMNIKEFLQKISEFNRLGENLYQAKKMSQLAEELDEIATHAAAYALREDENEAFDNITIKRNMNELGKYVNEFKKIAAENDRLNQRATALYEDAGKILGRYYEITDVQEGGTGSGRKTDKFMAVRKKQQKQGIIPKVDETNENISTYASENIPSTEREKQVKSQPMGGVNEIEERSVIVFTASTSDNAREVAKQLAHYGIKNAIPLNKNVHVWKDEFKKAKEILHALYPKRRNENITELFNVTKQLRKLHLQERSYNRTKSTMNPDERQAMFLKIKNNKILAEGITEKFINKHSKGPMWQRTGDLVKLSIPKFNSFDDSAGLYEELKDLGFSVTCNILEVRSPIGPGFFVEFYAPKDEFNDCNKIAVKLAPNYCA